MFTLTVAVGLFGGGVATAEPSVAPPPPPAPVPLFAPPAALFPPPPVAPMAPSDPVSLDIPALGEHTDAIVPLGLKADGSLQVPTDAHTVGRYTGAPPPGALGPAVLAGHVDWKGEFGLFHDLVGLHPGDLVRVGRADGSVAVFRVSRVEHYPKDAFPSSAVYGATDSAELRLITCGGEFDTTRRSYRDNVVVFTDLVEAQFPPG